MRYAIKAAILGHICLLFFALSTPVHAQTGKLTGQVISEITGDPLPGASIRVSGPHLTVKIGATSNAEGPVA